MRPRLIAAAIVVAALSALAPAAHAATSAATAGVAQSSAAACSYQRVGNTWRCITPGAYCPRAAHFKYGYAKVTSRKYRCSQYTSTTWRWKRA